MALVVAGHFADPYAKGSPLLSGIAIFAYLFHMPAFIFISGLFCKKTVQSVSFPFRKIAPYYLLFLLTQLVTFIAIRLFIYPPFQFRLLKIYTVAWFAFALFAFYLITWLIRGVSGRYSLPIALILASVAGYNDNIGDYLCLSRVIVFYPFFLAGYLTRQERAAALLEDHRIRALAAVVLLLAAAASYFIATESAFSYQPLLSLFRGRFPFSKIDFAAIPFAAALPPGVVRLVHILAAAALSFSFFALTPSANTFVTPLGRRTLGIYVFHMPFVYLCRQPAAAALIAAFFGSGWNVVCLLLAVELSFILSSERLNRPLERLLRLK